MTILVVVMGAMHVSTKAQMQKYAIEAGVAHWTVNPTNGTTTFEYIKPSK